MSGPRVQGWGIKITQDSQRLESLPKQDVPHVVTSPRHGWEQTSTGILSRGNFEVRVQFHDEKSTLLAEFWYAVSVKDAWPAA